MCPEIDVSGNFLVKFVYTVQIVSAAKNAMNTFSFFSSGLGVMSSFSFSVYFCIEFILFSFQSNCPFAAVILGVIFFATSVVLIPGHVVIFFVFHGL